MRIFLIIYVFVIVATVTILGFRGSLSTKTPLEVFPDMDHQAKYKPQMSNPFFQDGRNDRPIPVGTVARGNALNQQAVFSDQFADKRLGDTAFLQGKDMQGDLVANIPVDVSYELIEKGKKRYNIFCVSCHGAAGDGNGVTKPYGVLAANYHDDRLRNVPDGHIYNVIMNGLGLMYGLKDRLSPDEAWSIVLYVRALQLSQNASADALTAAQREELGF